MTNDPVLELDKELRAMAAERSQLAADYAKCRATGSSPQAIDAGFAALSEKWHPTMRRFADTPATTFDGVAAKLRILASSLASGRESVYDEDILLLAIADLERLAQETTRDDSFLGAGLES